MVQNVWMSPTRHPPRRGRGWLRALLIGLGLFVATAMVMLLTSNLNLYLFHRHNGCLPLCI